MNGKSIITRSLSKLRRPLLWALLCSLALHFPLLWPWLPTAQLPAAWAPDSVLLVELSVDPPHPVAEDTASANKLAEPDPDEMSAEPAVTPAPVSSLIANEPLQSAAEMSPQNPHVVDDSLPAAITVADATPPEAEVAPVLTPTPMPMLAQDADELLGAMTALVKHINDTGMNPAPSVAVGMTATALGLPDSDRVSATRIMATQLSALQQIEVTVTRRINGQAYQMRAQLQERALSHYAKFINRWDNNVVLANDRVDGRFHANTTVHFETAEHSRPQFNGEVTIASPQSVAGSLRRSSVFAGGLRTGTGRVALPLQSLPAHWLELGTTVQLAGRRATLEFAGTDGVIWSDPDNATQTLIEVPESGLILVGAERASITVSGTVAGRVLVYSPRQIVIAGSLTYADTSQTSSDMLTLISDGSIEVAASTVTGGGDLQIHGALFARQRFAVRRFRDRHQGTLHIRGALVAGAVSATEPRFATYVEYDRRFEHSRPPAFPSTGLFDLLAWEQSWTAVNDPDAFLASAADNAAIAAP